MAKGLWSSTTNLIGVARRILAREQPATIRQLFYRLVSIQALENSTPHYHKLIRIMTLARAREAIPFEWIVDRSRPTYAPNVFDDLEDGLRALCVGTARGGHRRFQALSMWGNSPSRGVNAILSFPVYGRCPRDGEPLKPTRIRFDHFGAL